MTRAPWTSTPPRPIRRRNPFAAAGWSTRASCPPAAGLPVAQRTTPLFCRCSRLSSRSSNGSTEFRVEEFSVDPTMDDLRSGLEKKVCLLGLLSLLRLPGQTGNVLSPSLFLLPLSPL